MALKMSGRNPAKFEWTDDVAETTVTIQPDDTSEVIQAKLQRVLDLEAGQGLPIRAPGAALMAAKETFEPLIDAVAAERRVAAQGAMGWNADLTDGDIESLPEYG